MNSSLQVHTQADRESIAGQLEDCNIVTAHSRFGLTSLFRTLGLTKLTLFLEQCSYLREGIIDSYGHLASTGLSVTLYRR
jgi:hypothetical protein